jgi:hypothetical protein
VYRSSSDDVTGDVRVTQVLHLDIKEVILECHASPRATLRIQYCTLSRFPRLHVM